MSSLTAVQKWSYAIGNVPYTVKDTAFGSFVVFYYTQVLGLSGSLAGLAMFIALTWDAISDPIVGSWSDSLRTRWGRRHPMLVAGGIPTALMFLLLFPPQTGLGQTGLFLWLVIVSIFLRTFLTVYYIPFSAMGAELSTDYDERTVIAKARVSVGWLSGVAITAIAYTVFFTTTGDVDGRLVAENYRAFGILCATVAAATALICIFGTRSVIPNLPKQRETDSGFSLSNFLSELRLAWGLRNFRFNLGASLAFGAAAGVYTTLSLYMGTYFWEFSAEQLAGLVVPAVIATIFAFLTLNRLGTRFDKHTLLCAASLLMGFNMFWMVGLRLFGLLPANGHPVLYPMMLLTAFLGVYCVIAVQVLSVSLIADLVDEQELKTQKRQEGIYFAASMFINKATTGLGALIGGIIIDLAGVQAGAAPGSVAESILTALGGFYTGVIGGFSVIAYWFYRRISLGRAQLQKVQDALKRVRADSLSA
ncbi:MAG: MFS transporter [Halioglobus sp.]